MILLLFKMNQSSLLDVQTSATNWPPFFICVECHFVLSLTGTSLDVRCFREIMDVNETFSLVAEPFHFVEVWWPSNTNFLAGCLQEALYRILIIIIIICLIQMILWIISKAIRYIFYQCFEKTMNCRISYFIFQKVFLLYNKGKQSKSLENIIKMQQVFLKDKWICKLCNMKKERKSDYILPFAWQSMCTWISICVCGPV